ncbi:MAG: tyrosine-type recombinase/integrase [bacterium]
MDFNEGYQGVNHGKGDKDRVVPIGEIACHYLETYSKGIRPMFYKAKEQKALFLSKKGLPISRSSLAEIITKYAKQSGLEKKITPHTFRRSCATGMIKNSVNLMHVKELLGHNSMETVQIYCRLCIVNLKEAHKRCHPGEKDKI